MDDPPLFRDAFAGLVACLPTSCCRAEGLSYAHIDEVSVREDEEAARRVQSNERLNSAAASSHNASGSALRSGPAALNTSPHACAAGYSNRSLVLTSRQRRDAQTHARNMLLIMVGTVLLLTALFGLQSLESSLNSAGGVGEICLALIYGLGVLSVTFLSPILLRRLGPPVVQRICVIPLMLFVVAHFKFAVATFLSSCTLLGLVFMMFQTANSVMTASAGIDYADIYGIPRSRMLTRFSSLFFVALAFSYVTGPLIVSLIIHNPDAAGGNNGTGVQTYTTCQLSDERLVILDRDRYVLLTVYLVLLVLSFAVFCLVRTASSTTIKAKLASATAWQQITATVRLVADFDMLLMIPWIFFTGMTKEMITANFTKFYISSCLGIANVGYAVASFGIGSTLTSAFMSPLLKRTNRPVAAGMVVAVEVGVIVVLLLWERTPNAALLYGLSGIWGAGDGIWNVLLSVVLGVVFPTQQEAAFSNHRGWQGLGFAFSAVYSQRFGSCLDQLKIKFMLMLGLLFLSMILYTVLEWRIRKFGRERQRSNEITDMEPLQTWTSKEELCMTSL